MIPVLNVYYMLSYAFKVLNEQGYKSIETEKFANTADLCAAILARGTSIQLKRGLLKGYVLTTEELTCPRGKIEITDSIKTRNLMRRQLVCTHDEFTVDFYMNQIIKTTMVLLLHSDIPQARKKELRRLLVYLDDVSMLDVHTINWKLQYNRNNQSYRMLISICYLVIKGLLQAKTNGTTKMMDFLDEQRMHHLYEKFIMEYYRKEYPQITANASQIAWQLDDGFRELLPIMQSDIMLTYQDRTLIIDAKYYEHSLQKQYDRLTAYSNNLYQIFTYVKNKEAGLRDKPHEKVAGMLLYAQTEDEGAFEKEYKMSGNPISIKTLDLNQDFSGICSQLDYIAEKYLNVQVA
ncbi:MAG: 5-methylcytosine-specific restriction endonuclease system specificity protein McrC [Lachnospiraceae bacterium]|nr:5-methylcytosine-specific restriction endonuclease system specificity protein McrC [Lachnospiraceae bacterium]